MNGRGSSTSRAEAQKLKAEARSKKVTKRRAKQVTEAFNIAWPKMRQGLAADMSNAMTASGAMPAVDSEVARENIKRRWTSRKRDSPNARRRTGRTPSKIKSYFKSYLKIKDNGQEIKNNRQETSPSVYVQSSVQRRRHLSETNCTSPLLNGT